jgi:hypothetical protein
MSENTDKSAAEKRGNDLFWKIIVLVLLLIIALQNFIRMSKEASYEKGVRFNYYIPGKKPLPPQHLPRPSFVYDHLPLVEKVISDGKNIIYRKLIPNLKRVKVTAEVKKQTLIIHEIQKSQNTLDDGKGLVYTDRQSESSFGLPPVEGDKLKIIRQDDMLTIIIPLKKAVKKR